MPVTQRLPQPTVNSQLFVGSREHGLPDPVAADLPMLLAAGGDKRIVIDPVSGRNRYGTRTNPAGSERSFASTTASNTSIDSYHAAETA